jgi:hypothetical protein
VTFLRSLVRFSDILFTDFLLLILDALTNFILDNHYKIDLTPKKEAIKVMIQDELTKLSEEDEEGEGDGDKHQQPQAKEIEA